MRLRGDLHRLRLGRGRRIGPARRDVGGEVGIDLLCRHHRRRGGLGRDMAGRDRLGLAQEPFGHGLAVADHEEGHEEHADHRDQRRDAAACGARGAFLDDRHDQELPVAQKRDAEAHRGREIARRTVTQRDDPQIARRGRQDEPHGGAQEFDREEGVEIERLAQADLSGAADHRDGQHIADGPGAHHDQHVEGERPDIEQDALHDPGGARPLPHAAVGGNDRPAQQVEDRRRGHDQQQKLDQRIAEHAQIEPREPREQLGRGLERIPEAPDTGRNRLRRLLGEEGRRPAEGEDLVGGRTHCGRRRLTRGGDTFQFGDELRPRLIVAQEVEQRGGRSGRGGLFCPGAGQERGLRIGGEKGDRRAEEKRQREKQRGGKRSEQSGHAA